MFKYLLWRDMVSSLVSHSLPQIVGPGRRSLAYWADDPNGSVVVFVHGFNGRPVSSWLEFPSRLPEEPAWTGSDLVFFGYDGRYAPVMASALVLAEFLDELMAGHVPTNVASGRRSARQDGELYRRLVVVGHSLGAVVARRALLEARRPIRADWLTRTHLVLFAPAHRGADVASLVLEGLVGFPVAGPGLAAWVAYRFPPARELAPLSSTLTDLERESAEAYATGENAVQARAIAFGERDRIVRVENFLNDPRPKIFLERGHSDVCKPIRGFLEPVDLFKELI